MREVDNENELDEDEDETSDHSHNQPNIFERSVLDKHGRHKQEDNGNNLEEPKAARNNWKKGVYLKYFKSFIN